MNALRSPRMYVPVDIAGDFLALTVARFQSKYPAVCTKAVVADFNQDFDLPAWLPSRRRLAFFTGSTIGNLDRCEASQLLARMRTQVAPGHALIGVDLEKDIGKLLRAYDDREGVTAAFNLNLLERLNRELDGNFDLHAFQHEARWNEDERAVEMHLVSSNTTTVTLLGKDFKLSAGESIHTESSRKYRVETFGQLASETGWHTEDVWLDADSQFAIFALGSER